MKIAGNQQTTNATRAPPPTPKLTAKKRHHLIHPQLLLGTAIAVFSLVSLWLSTALVQQQQHDQHDRDTKTTTAITTTTTTTTTSIHQSPGVVTIGHAISLIFCQRSTRVKGFLDALIILRHSIHQNSIHASTNASKKKSKYSYQMYAIVNANDANCVAHVPLLRRLGYIPVVKTSPINISSISSNDWYRTHVEGENCCGSAEFLKLYAYTLTQHPVVVHWDLDVAVLQPLDDLYDAMLYPAESSQGRIARQRLQVQHPSVQLPASQIQAFFTRDVTSARPWEQVQAVQGGFVVARPNITHFEMYRTFIHQANYTPGRGPTSGWGGMGYGGFQGAMAYQGVLAYFYDQIYSGHSVELDVCRWNQVVADVIWRGPDHMEHAGQCRDHPLDGNYDTNTPENGRCEDCRVIPIDEVKTVHYTACKKPWECTLPHPRIPGKRREAHAYRLRELTNVTTCGLLFAKYFEIRQDIEKQIVQKGGFAAKERNGGLHPEYFLGYCKRGGGYDSMDEIDENFDMKMVYGF